MERHLCGGHVGRGDFHIKTMHGQTGLYVAAMLAKERVRTNVMGV